MTSTDIRLSARIFALSSDDEYLIEITIRRLIVIEWNNIQLKGEGKSSKTRAEHSTDLFGILAIGIASEYDQKDVENTSDNHGQIDSLVAKEITVGKDMIPVDRWR
jgi:hypothetical protein